MTVSHSGQGLYPIIRRARRPLIIEDDDSGPATAPLAVPMVEAEAPVSYAKRDAPARKGKHATKVSEAKG